MQNLMVTSDVPLIVKLGDFGLVNDYLFWFCFKNKNCQ
jgi:hypothetical protein